MKPSGMCYENASLCYARETAKMILQGCAESQAREKGKVQNEVHDIMMGL